MKKISFRKSLLRGAFVSLLAALTILPSAANAEIVSQNERGFAIIHIGDVSAEPDEIWRNLLLPNTWWSKNHSWSGDSENFYLEPKVNGCFCELLPAEDDGVSDKVGEVEHMRIIHIDRNKTLRMQGALGPLQSEAVNGTLTIAIKSNGDGTSKFSFSYVVGGYMRHDVSKIASSMNVVIGEQFENLVKVLGPALTVPEKNESEGDDPLSLNELLLGDDSSEEVDDEKAETNDELKASDDTEGDESTADKPKVDVRRER